MNGRSNEIEIISIYVVVVNFSGYNFGSAKWRNLLAN